MDVSLQSPRASWVQANSDLTLDSNIWAPEKQESLIKVRTTAICFGSSLLTAASGNHEILWYLHTPPGNDVLRPVRREKVHTGIAKTNHFQSTVDARRTTFETYRARYQRNRKWIWSFIERTFPGRTGQDRVERNHIFPNCQPDLAFCVCGLWSKM